jgi:hypothetical protein
MKLKTLEAGIFTSSMEGMYKLVLNISNLSKGIGQLGVMILF